MIWLWPLSPNGEPVHSQGKIELSSQNAVGVSKWADVLGRAALTNGSWKMQDRLIISIVLLSKEVSQIFPNISWYSFKQTEQFFDLTQHARNYKPRHNILALFNNFA